MSKRRRPSDSNDEPSIKAARLAMDQTCYLLDYCTADARSWIWEALSYADRARLSGTCATLQTESGKYTKVLRRMFACIWTPPSILDTLWLRRYPDLRKKMADTVEIAASCLSTVGWDTLGDADWTGQRYLWTIGWCYGNSENPVALWMQHAKVAINISIHFLSRTEEFLLWDRGTALITRPSVVIQVPIRLFGHWFRWFYSPGTDFVPDMKTALRLMS